MEPGGPQGRQQGGRCAEDPVRHNGRAQEVRQKAAHCQAGNGAGEQEGQHRQRLGHPELDPHILGDGQQQGQGGIDAGDDAAQGQLVGGKTGFGHEKRPPLDGMEACTCRKSYGIRSRSLHFFV